MILIEAKQVQKAEVFLKQISNCVWKSWIFCKEEKFFTVVCTCTGIFSYIFSSQECSDQ